MNTENFQTILESFYKNIKNHHLTKMIIRMSVQDLAKISFAQ